MLEPGLDEPELDEPEPDEPEPDEPEPDEPELDEPELDEPEATGTHFAYKTVSADNVVGKVTAELKLVSRYQPPNVKPALTGSRKTLLVTNQRVSVTFGDPLFSTVVSLNFLPHLA